MLQDRGYSEQMIDRGIERARKIPRNAALLKVKTKEKKKRPVFAIKYDPRLPSIPNIVARHWRSMGVQDSYLKDVFEEPPLTAFRRQNNLRDMLIKSKVPPPPSPYPQRETKGMARCGNSCPSCPYVLPGKTVKIDIERQWRIDKKVNCNTFNCIYMLQCTKENCKNRYIGQTGRFLRFRIADHKGYITNQVTSKATGAHWNQPGHSLADMKFTVLEQVKYNDEAYRKERETFFINKFNTFYKGINKEK